MREMLGLSNLESSTKRSRRILSRGILPSFIEENRPPNKRQPFSTILSQRWMHTIDLLIPSEVYKRINQRFEKTRWRDAQYAKVFMKLGEILEGDFFQEYVKKGGVIMLSEGRHGVDNRFELFNGILRIELSKPVYERAGLVGKPISDGGLKYKKNRFGTSSHVSNTEEDSDEQMNKAIEFNLLLPSMIPGKKGFDRLKWACKNVLNESLTWLFFDFGSLPPARTTRRDDSGIESKQHGNPIDKHHPQWYPLKPSIHHLNNVHLPHLHPSKTTEKDPFRDPDFATELEDHFSLILLNSPRVNVGDDPNPFICRYSPPLSPYPSTLNQSLHDSKDENQERQGHNLTLLRYHAFIPSQFVIHLIIALKQAFSKVAEEEENTPQNSAKTGTDKNVEDENKEDWTNFYFLRTQSFDKGDAGGKRNTFSMLKLPSQSSSNTTKKGEVSEEKGEMDVEMDVDGNPKEKDEDQGMIELEHELEDLEKKMNGIERAVDEFVCWSPAR